MDKDNFFLKITGNRSRIMATVVAMVRNFDEAEDLFQETVIEIMRSSETFDDTRDFAPWACAIARNVVRRHWRRNEVTSSIITQDALAQLAAIAVENSEPDRWREELRALRACLKKLPERMHKLLILRYGHNYRGQDLAQRSSVKLSSLRTTLARLRENLRLCVAGTIRSNAGDLRADT